MGIGGKAVVVLDRGDVVAELSFRNLPDVLIVEPGHLTAYDVLWSDDVVFTTETLGLVGRSGSYEVSDSDFVKEEGGEG